MGDRTSYPPGTFSWVDLGTTDAEAARSFYTALFGWETEDTQVEEDPDRPYTICRMEGKDVAGLYEMADEQRHQRVPPLWTSYITVGSVDTSAARVRGLGGLLPVEPFDLEGMGRMALAQDPTGATFALWEPRGHIGAGRVNDVGCFTFNELATGDPAAATRFYTALLGWKAEPTEMASDRPYTVYKVGERMNAGMAAMTERHGDAPPNWLVYFTVASCDVAQAIVEARGGSVLVPPAVLSMGRFAIVQDPQGAAFGLFEGDVDD